MVETLTGAPRPEENSIESIRAAMTHFDGVEFDLRFCSDGELVLFHDNHLSKAQQAELGGPRWTEDNSSEDLAEVGVATFAQLLEDSEFMQAWRDTGKVACIELKMPHPKAKNGGHISARRREKHAAMMARKVDELLAPLELSPRSAVLWSFKRNFRRAATRASVRWPVAQLKPHIPEIGGITTKRLLTLPSFMWLSLPFHMKWQQHVGAPMLPCALEYLHGWTRHITLGRTAGLSGYTARRLNRMRTGYQAYVWPAPLSLEKAMFDQGLTAVSDHGETDLWTRPDGSARWQAWASRPLDAEWRARFDQAPAEEHEALVKQARAEVSPWHELSAGERESFLADWRTRWQWERDLDELVADASPESMPWEASRFIGHRGLGRTSGRIH